MLLVQLLVLAFTAALWWIARRDLASRSAPVPPAAGGAESGEHTQALEQLCVSLEALASDLARRVDALERQTARAVPPGGLTPGAIFDTGAAPEIAPAGDPAPVSVSWRPPAPELAASEADRAVAALLASGVTDPAEIAHRATLSRGEVDLILSLRARQAL